MTIKKARLILEDNSIYNGQVFAHGKESIGEVIFNTSMVGYQEVLTDPSYKNQMVVSPDVGGVERTRDLANRIKADLAIIDKRRPAPGKSEVMNILGNVKNKTCIIVDDIIDSGGTIINAVNALIKSGANEVYVFISHGVLSGDAAKKIKNSKIKKLVVTDTIDNSKKINNNSKIEVLSISSLMSEAIKRIANSNSVSDLFN